jgi:hypothetical protein
MSTLPSLLKELQTLHRQQVETEREIADVERQIVAAGREPRSRRKRGGKAEMVEVVRDTVNVLREAGVPLPRQEIAARLGIKASAAHYRLQRAVALKFVERVGQGRYRLTSVLPVQ